MCYTPSIRTKADNLHSFFVRVLGTSQFWLVFFVCTFVIVQSVALGAYRAYAPHKKEIHQNIGGPVSEVYTKSDSDFILSFSSYSFLEAPLSANGESQGSAIIFTDSATAVGATHPFSNVIPIRQGLMKYKVREGDTLSGIAAQFGISLETLKWANLSVGSVISPGQELTILPVSGILYEVGDGDTIEGVAARYHLDPELIKKYNPDYITLLESSGQTIILPYAKPINRWAYINKYRKSLPNLDSYFTLPARGWNWGELHYYNAVDIAASCGEPVYASAEGLVIEASSENRWNDGYGNYVLIEHPNRTKTRYAHTLKNLVAEGDYVLQGEKVALIGKSGNTHGPTGCHLHFEVYGARNPFAVR